MLNIDELAQKMYSEYPTHCGTRAMQWEEAPREVRAEWKSKAYAAAPLLAEIERLKAENADLARLCKDLSIAYRQASNAQAEPLVLERLNAEEVRKAIIDEGMMFTAPDYRVAAAIQSAIAAKNGAKLK